MKFNLTQSYCLRLALILLWVLVLTSVSAAQTPDPLFDIQDVTSIRVSPDGTRLAVTKQVRICDVSLPGRSTIEIVNVGSGELNHQINSHPCVRYAVWSPDGTKLASTGSDGTVRIWDTTTGNQLASGYAVLQGGTSSLSWRADGSLLAGILPGAGFVALYDVPTGEQLVGFGTVTYVSSSRWHPTNPNLLATLEVDDMVRFWNANGQLQSTLPLPNAHLGSMTWSPDGTRFLFYSTDNTLLVVEATSGTILQQIDFATETLSDLNWSLDGHLVYASNYDGMLRVWDAHTGELVDEVVDSSLAINSVAVVPIAAGEYRMFYGGTVRGQPLDGELAEKTVLYMSPVNCNYAVGASDVAGLIAAINSANGNGTPDTICLSRSTYTLTTVDNTDDGDNGLPVITSDITIYGNGATITRDAGAPAFRVFKVNAGESLTLENLTVSGGWAAGYGGAAYVKGSLVARNVTFTGNHAEDDGGAIYSTGTLTLRGSRFEGNTSSTGRTVARRP